MLEFNFILKVRRLLNQTWFSSLFTISWGVINRLHQLVNMIWVPKIPELICQTFTRKPQIMFHSFACSSTSPISIHQQLAFIRISIYSSMTQYYHKYPQLPNVPIHVIWTLWTVSINETIFKWLSGFWAAANIRHPLPGMIFVVAAKCIHKTHYYCIHSIYSKFVKDSSIVTAGFDTIWLAMKQQV